MKNKKQIWFILCFLLLAAFAFQSANAQLVNINEKYKVNKVDTKLSRLEVMPLDRSVKNVAYVKIDGYTICSHNQQIVKWTEIKPGMVIRVKGGLKWNMEIKASKIYW